MDRIPVPRGEGWEGEREPSALLRCGYKFSQGKSLVLLVMAVSTATPLARSCNPDASVVIISDSPCSEQRGIHGSSTGLKLGGELGMCVYDKWDFPLGTNSRKETDFPLNHIFKDAKLLKCFISVFPKPSATGSVSKLCNHQFFKGQNQSQNVS